MRIPSDKSFALAPVNQPMGNQQDSDDIMSSMPMISLTLILLAFFAYLGTLVEVDKSTQVETIDSVRSSIGSLPAFGTSTSRKDTAQLKYLRDTLTKLGLQTTLQHTTSASVLILSVDLEDVFNERDSQLRASFLPILEELTSQRNHLNAAISINTIEPLTVDQNATVQDGLTRALSLYRFFLDRSWPANAISIKSQKEVDLMNARNKEITIELTSGH